MTTPSISTPSTTVLIMASLDNWLSIVASECVLGGHFLAFPCVARPEPEPLLLLWIISDFVQVVNDVGGHGGGYGLFSRTGYISLEKF